MDKTQIKEFIPDNYNNLQDFWVNSYPAEMLKGVIGIIDYLSLGEITRDLDYQTSYYIAEKFYSDKLSEILRTMYADDDADILNKYDLFAVPVVNKNEQMLGIITTYDILKVTEDETTEDIYIMAATTNVYDLKGGLLSIVKKDYPCFFYSSINGYGWKCRYPVSWCSI